MQAMAELREVASKWEAQTQRGLAQSERLKDLLEESAAWDAAAQQAQQAGGAGSGSGGGGSGDLPALCERLQGDLLQERARSAQLDLQVRLEKVAVCSLHRPGCQCSVDARARDPITLLGKTPAPCDLYAACHWVL